MSSKLNSVVVSAPGSVMITGEHAVVYDYPAIVSAIAQRITIKAKKIATPKLIIRSQLANYESEDINNIQSHSDLKFVLACVQSFFWDSGLELSIESEINHELGLGSSAAVTVACLHALQLLQKLDWDKYQLHEKALGVIHNIQKRGSGSDLAASIWGGMLAYYPNPLAVKTLAIPKAIIGLSNCGYKTPTADVLALISEKMAISPAKFKNLYQEMGEKAAMTINAACAENWDVFYQCLNDYQLLMAELGVSDNVLDEMLLRAHASSSALASKISGSGLGDCIISFSKEPLPEHQQIAIDTQGIITHEKS